MNKTQQIQEARAVIEVVRKRLAYRNHNNEIVETNVVDSLQVVDKEMQKTLYAAEPSKLASFGFPVGSEAHFEYMQVIDGRPVQGFGKGDILVVP